MPKIKQYNQALGSSFRLVIPGMEEINYFVQNTELPGMNFMGIRTDYKNNYGNVPNNKIEYDMLNLTFLVDENYTNHTLIHQWFRDLAFGKKPILQELKDISLHITTSTKTQNRIITYYGAHPVMMTPVSLESGTSDSMPLTCTVSFMYQYYDNKPME